MSTLEQAKNELNTYVKVTTALIKERYDYWNQKAFDGELPNDIVFVASSLPRTTSGTTDVTFDTSAPIATLKRISDPSKFLRNVGSITVRITTKAQMTQEIFDGVLLHEMIHVALYSKKMMYHGHGKEFMAKLRDIEVKSGRRIPVGHGIDEQPGDFPSFESYPARDVIVIVWTKRGQRAFTIVSTKAKDQVQPFLDKVRARESIQYKNDSVFEAYETKTPLASMVTVHRGLKSAVSFVTLKDMTKLDHAIANGKKIG